MIKKRWIFAGLSVLAIGYGYLSVTSFCFKEMKYLSEDDLCSILEKNLDNPKLQWGTSKMKSDTIESCLLTQYRNQIVVSFTETTGPKMFAFTACGQQYKANARF